MLYDVLHFLSLSDSETTNLEPLKTTRNSLEVKKSRWNTRKLLVYPSHTMQGWLVGLEYPDRGVHQSILWLQLAKTQACIQQRKQTYHFQNNHIYTHIDTFKPLFSTSSHHEVASCHRIFPKSTGRPLPHRNVPSVAHVQLLYDATASSYVSRIAPGEFSRSKKNQHHHLPKKSLGSHGINLPGFSNWAACMHPSYGIPTWY